MLARFIEVINNEVKILGKKNIDLLPREKDRIVWVDDKNYSVVSIAWDFYHPIGNEVVIELTKNLRESE